MAFKPHLFKTLAAAAMVLGAQDAGAALVFNTDGNGVLTGVTGLSVDGAVYDVQFQTGACATVFPDGCAVNGSAVFTVSAVTENTFSTALFGLGLDSYVQQGGNSSPSLTMIQGCDVPTTGAIACSIFVPFQISPGGGPLVQAIELDLTVSPSSGGTNSASIIDISYDSAGITSLSPDTALSPNQTWAVFTAETAAPEPGTAALLLAGAAGLAGARGKKKRAARGKAQT